MKRLTTLLLLLCCLPFMAMAQDLNPGQQSQGLLESRNVTVDYSTGIFHYQIPLYTLKSGDYELPISLRYTGKGVKVSDNPGLVGYNWTLDTGGIVTRTVRGGIPDEDFNYGYLKFENDPTPLLQDATRVNRHKRDGECDIFTAIFGGKSVNFIIRKNDNGGLYAEPLERTDVKIECANSGNLINGWIVTDNDGTRYTYMRTEWTCNLNKQDEISFNGLSNLEYVSSWHLTSIEPVNSEAIMFEYLGTETNSPTTNQRRVTRCSDTYLTKYEYGRPLEMPIFDFNAYKERFNAYINEAMAAVQDHNIQLQINSQMYLYNSKIGWYQNPYLDDISEQMKTNHRVLGMGDFSQVSSVSDELLELLQELSLTYEGYNQIASIYFRNAYNVLLECINGVFIEYVSEREVNNGITYAIASPVLEAITSGEKVLFRYDHEYGRLYNIKKETIKGNTVSAYDFSYSSNNLEAVISLDKDSIPVETVSMTYYAFPNGASSMPDVFGFQKPYSSDPFAPFDFALNEEFAKIHSLKEIHSTDGGNICLDYELNALSSTNEGIPLGGIRIKSIVLDNPSEEHCDTISYQYELSKTTFWEYPKNSEIEVYDNFIDRVTHSKAKSRGYATLSPGNNGIYYPIVRENISGQGTRILHSNFTDYGPELSHAHWLVGLPTLIVELDEAGNVQRVLQNLYYTDMENGAASCLFPESLIHLDAASYDKFLSQMVADEKYMDLEDVKREMNIGTGENMNIHNERAFWTNIAPRIRSSYLNILYSQYYGGATVLAEQREYRPQAGEFTDYRTLMEQQPCSRTVYHYDNLQNHTRPTRIVNYDSQGDSTVIYQVYIGDMATTASEGIAAMQEANILSPVIKHATVKDGALTEEEVIVYETVTKENGYFYAPGKVVVRNGSNGSYIPDTLSLYAGNMTNYQEREKITSAVIGEDSYLPVGMTEQGMHTAFIHDPNNKWCVLQATDVSADKMLAVDCRQYRLNMPMFGTDVIGRILYLAEKFQNGIEGYNPESIQLDRYQEFRMTPFYKGGKTLLELLGKETDISEIADFLENCPPEAYTGINEYITWQFFLAYNYFPTAGIDSPWNMNAEEMTEFEILLMNELHINNGSNLMNYLRTSDGTSKNGFRFVPQTLAVLSGQQGYKLYLVPMEVHTLVTYTIIHNGGTAKRTLNLSGLTPGVLQEVSIDLSGYDNVSGITVTGFEMLQHLTLLPEGTEFEATSYNADGSIALKYDNSGHMELYEYDKAGRLILIRDENGKILKGNEYNKKSANL